MKLRLKGVGICTSVLIEVDGNKATGECYGIAVGSQSEDGTLVDSMYGGRYLDEFERREGSGGYPSGHISSTGQKDFPTSLRI